jgi:NADPH:quinone reductase-like Zn-dependent oxidoreductase
MHATLANQVDMGTVYGICSVVNSSHVYDLAASSLYRRRRGDMRAVGLESFEEGPKVLDLPTPRPGSGEVLVNVRHSSINGFDVGVAFGMVKDLMEHRFPVVLGKDFAGTVEAVGEGVSGFSEGDAVFGVLMREYVGDGTLADYVVVPEAIGITKLPQGLDPATAGALGLAGTAAHLSVGAISPDTGETLLISGATGGVGAQAIQLAGRRGSRVIATARPGEEAEFVSRLGAHHTVDYSGDVASQVRAIAGNGVDAAIHLAGDARELATLVRRGGRFASTLGVGPDQLAGKDLKATAIMAMPTADVLNDLALSVLAGELELPIARTYTLEEAPRAIQDFAQGSLGKLAVAIS